MSKHYRETTGLISEPTTSPEMRAWSQRPGTVGNDGRPLYKTEQVHKDICDVNNIIKEYDKKGVISHVSKIEAKYGDLSGMDFKTMQETIINAGNMFNELPSKIRNRFKNDPQKLIEFMDSPDNREEAIKLGLINPDWTLETDGLGEYIKLGENKKKIDDDPVINDDPVIE